MNKNIYVTPEHILDYIEEKSKEKKDDDYKDMSIEDRKHFILEDM